MKHSQYSKYPVTMKNVCLFFTDPGLLVFPPHQQPRYKNIRACICWPVLGFFNNWNIITFSYKAMKTEVFENIKLVALDGISDNMTVLVQSGKYGAINTTDKSTTG